MKRIIARLALCLVFLLNLAPAAAADSAPFTPEDLIQEGDTGNAAVITLDGTSAQCSGKADITEGVVTIRDGGTYVLTGSYQGEIIIDAGKSDSVQLVLDNAHVTSEASAAIYVKKAEKATIVLQGSSTLQNSGSYANAEDSKVDAVIYSKSDLVLKGNGSLDILAQAGNGIVSKDSLVITGGSYTIHAEGHGLTGKDSLRIAGGSFSIESGKDGIHAKNSDDAALGYLYISGGEFAIASTDDGISATGALQIDAGNFRIVSGGGSENGNMKPSDAFGMQRDWGNLPNETTSQDTASAKGIKSDNTIRILGGFYTLDCADDAIHAGAEITIESGDFTIRTADDGIHSDSSVTIQNGQFTLPYCYEGIEGETVTVNGGSINITSTDDGINASGGADGSGYWGGFGGNANAYITINGGEIIIVSDGDSLDSNGSLTLNGGTLNLTCNGYGNTAIDYETEFANNGADVTTNDGSENGTDRMHGGFGQRGGNFRQFGDQGEFDGQRRPMDDMGTREPFGQRPDVQGRPGQFPNAIPQHS